MPSNKKKKCKNNIPKGTFEMLANEEDSDSGVSGIFIFEESIKPNFTDEFDLFKYFFSYFRKTGQITSLIQVIHRLSTREPGKLFECGYANYSSDPKFAPIKFEHCANETFTTSNKITIKFNKLRNRFVEANSKIKRGEVLSVERSLVFTDKPNTSNDSYGVYRCHKCLRIITYFVTCPYCDVAIFCSYECRDKSWYEYHVWECYGLQRNFWNISSFEYVAMRMLFLGAKYQFDIGEAQFQNRYDKVPDIHVKGDFANPYKYLYRFTYNLKNKSKMDLAHMLMKCAGILIYLVECTHFFTWFSKLPRFKEMKAYEMYLYIGGLLTRHYSQCEIHQVRCEQIVMISVPFFDRVDFSSVGMFVSESIYSTNCKPNSIFCIRENILVVKATEDIEPGQKITVNWHPNQESCSCEHCLRRCQLNAFFCINCKGPVVPLKDADKLKYRNFDYDNVLLYIKNPSSPLTCKLCKNTFDIDIYENLNSVGQYYIAIFKQQRDIRFLLKAIQEYKNIFQPTHIFNSYLYIMALEFYINGRHTENPEELADILTKYLVVVELHFGKYSKMLLTGRCSMFLQILDMYHRTTLNILKRTTP